MNGGISLQHPEIMDSIPVPIFLVDDDVRILDLNSAASSAFGVLKDAIYLRRGGEVLHCLHSLDVPEGCGRGPACKSCVIRNSVASSVNGTGTTRRRMKFEIGDPHRKEMELMITANPLPHSDGKVVLLIVEDITELTKLRAIIPICSQCKKIRNEVEYWQQVEGYFHEYIGVEFTHGLCPDCLKKIYGDYIGKDPPAPAD